MPIAILLGAISTAFDDRLHDLIRTARTGDPAALSTVIDRVRLAALDIWPDIRSAVIAGVPGHRPGPANQLVLAVADELADIRGWDHVRDALQRIHAAPEAKAGGTRDVEAEAATLEWVSAPGGAPLVLIDDVVRSGSTLRACAAAVRATGDPRPIVAISVAARSAGDRLAHSPASGVDTDPLLNGTTVKGQ